MHRIVIVIDASPCDGCRARVRPALTLLAGASVLLTAASRKDVRCHEHRRLTLRGFTPQSQAFVTGQPLSSR